MGGVHIRLRCGSRWCSLAALASLLSRVLSSSSASSPSSSSHREDTPRASSRFPNAACSAPLPPAAQGIHSPRSQRRTQVHVQDDAGAAWRMWKGAREDAPIYWASVTQEWIAAAFHLRTQFGSEKGKCHPPHQTAMLSAILPYRWARSHVHHHVLHTHTLSLFHLASRRKTCVNLGTFLGAASVHRPPLHRLGEGSAGCRLLGSTDNASARPCDVPRWNLQPTMGPKSPLSSQVAEPPSLTCVKG